jgi:hypothetical protein
VRDRYRDGSIELELIDMLASEERVAVLVRERFHGHGPPVEISAGQRLPVRGGLIVEVSIFEADQYLGRRGLALGRPSPPRLTPRTGFRRGATAPASASLHMVRGRAVA